MNNFVTTIWMNLDKASVVEASSRYDILDSLKGRFYIIKASVPKVLIRKYLSSYSGYRQPCSTVVTSIPNLTTIRTQLVVQNEDGTEIKGAIGYFRSLSEDSTDNDTRVVEIVIDAEYQNDHRSLRKRKLTDGVWYHSTDRITGYRESQQKDDLLCRAAAIRDKGIMGAFDYHNFMPMDQFRMVYRVYEFIRKLQIMMIMTGTYTVEVENGSRYMPFALSGVSDWQTFWFNKVLNIPGNGGGTGFIKDGKKTASMHTHYRIQGEKACIYGNAYCEIKSRNAILTFISIEKRCDTATSDVDQVRSMFYKIFPDSTFPALKSSSGTRALTSIRVSDMGPVVQMLGIEAMAPYLTQIDHLIYAYYKSIKRLVPEYCPDICAYDVKPISDHAYGSYYNLAIQTQMHKPKYYYCLIRIIDYLAYHKQGLSGSDGIIQVHNINLEYLVIRDDFNAINRKLALALSEIYAKINEMYNRAQVYQEMTRGVDYEEAGSDLTYSL